MQRLKFQAKVNFLCKLLIVVLWAAALRCLECMLQAPTSLKLSNWTVVQIQVCGTIIMRSSHPEERADMQ